MLKTDVKGVVGSTSNQSDMVGGGWWYL